MLQVNPGLNAWKFAQQLREEIPQLYLEFKKQVERLLLGGTTQATGGKKNVSSCASILKQRLDRRTSRKNSHSSGGIFGESIAGSLLSDAEFLKILQDLFHHVVNVQVVRGFPTSRAMHISSQGSKLWRNNLPRLVRSKYTVQNYLCLC